MTFCVWFSCRKLNTTSNKTPSNIVKEIKENKVARVQISVNLKSLAIGNKKGERVQNLRKLQNQLRILESLVRT